MTNNSWNRLMLLKTSISPFPAMPFSTCKGTVSTEFNDEMNNGHRGADALLL